jgi:hypothetical protein
MTTVLIVDDHDSYRALARRLLVSEGFDVVGESADGPLPPSRTPSACSRRSCCSTSSCPTSTASRWRGGWPPCLTRRPWCSARAGKASDYGGQVRRASVNGFISKADLSGTRLAALMGRSR